MTDVRDRLGFGAVAFAALMALAPAAAVGGGMALAPIQGLAGVLAAPWRRLLRAAMRHWMVVVSIALFVGWMGIAASWSPSSSAVEQAVKLGALAITALLLIAGAGGAHERDRALIRAACMAAVALTALMLLVEAFADMPINRLDEAANVDPVKLMRNPAKGASFLVLMLWPAMGALIGGAPWERGAWKILFALSAVCALQFGMEANALALGVGLVAFLIALSAPRFALIALGLGLAGWLIAAPFVTPVIMAQEALVARLPDSWAIRAEMWTFVSERIREALVMGHGMDAARTIEGQSEVRGIVFNLVSLHPHSASLQIWYELGAVGAGLGALALIVGGFAAAAGLAKQREAAAAVAGVMASAGVIANVSFGAWQEWWLSGIVIAAACANAVRRANSADSFNPSAAP